MNHLILLDNYSLFYGSNPTPIRNHGHPTIQLVISEEEPFKSKNAEGHWVDKQGLLIAPNHKHECDAQNIKLLSLDIDPESLLGEWIVQNYLKEQNVIDYPFERNKTFDFTQLAKWIETKNWTVVNKMVNDFFYFQKTELELEKDERIDKVQAYIAENIHNEITTSILADLVHLSESRLVHLFKEKMGLPIRNYILWYRLKLSISELQRGCSLTQAALTAGFFDQSHFTRTFVNMMGIAPSTLMNNSKFVQVSIPK
ncbi:helix-turn-helix domain-containing protein [Chondrinema litorale]|uniref:helix-turn-helix domain-containing protein n=1 Tax=Chondrinema litorale TaxID=2994555 RepID=UPI002543F3C9|nr:AraC family transcriptional regulator [Chondrinema litorale]UZR96616.1 AraC family transcriptional regulator [Chondrinema litorale]